MDYSNIGVVCSDIDLFHVTPKGFLILGEIKNYRGELKYGQKALLSKLVDANEHGGTVLFITHNHDVYEGATTVDVSKCYVKEYYWQGRWVKPNPPILVRDAMQRLEEM